MQVIADYGVAHRRHREDPGEFVDAVLDLRSAVFAGSAGVGVDAAQPRSAHAAGDAVVPAGLATGCEVFAGAGHGGRMRAAPLTVVGGTLIVVQECSYKPRVSPLALLVQLGCPRQRTRQRRVSSFNSVLVQLVGLSSPVRARAEPGASAKAITAPD